MQSIKPTASKTAYAVHTCHAHQTSPSRIFKSRFSRQSLPRQFPAPSRLLKTSAIQTRSSRPCLSVSVSAEISYVMIKPDGVQRGLVGQIISKFENKGFQLKGLKLFQCPKELAEEHYGELKERPFFPALVEYITSGPVVCMVWEGDGVVASARKLIGKTDPLEAEPGTIRGDFAVHKGRNVVHGSDSPDNGIRETGLWFNEAEVIDWNSTMRPWIVEE